MIQKIVLPVLVFCTVYANAYSAPDRPEISSDTTEAQLVKSLQAINRNRLDVALNEVDNLLSANPNFKLAQLVKGDLLMAHAGEINNIGSAANGPEQQIEDLREEARIRLQRVLARPDSALIPSYLWKLDAEEEYVLVVDTSKATLYVYKNVDGTPRYVTDFYVTIGKLGADKSAEGDQRTPLGVYFVTAALPKDKLADIYGITAFPLNYPNEWDVRNKKTGSGIWLHGTPSDTYSRPPKASNGCLVLTNDDLEKLAPYLQIGVTPVIIANDVDWASESDSTDRDGLLRELENWRNDWASVDTDAYLTHYAIDFLSDGLNYAAWKQRKHLVNSAKTWISVDISNLSVFTYPGQPNLVVVSFDQDYHSNNLSNRMKKRQYWRKKDNRWQIIYEGAA
jgi:murein L,D-transpeptidase YafK